MPSIYYHPETYDLEHSGPEPDIDFFVSLARQLRPERILDVACGNGRITIPLARAAVEWGGSVNGIDVSESMLADARQKSAGFEVRYEKGDVRDLKVGEPYDLILSACGSLSHLLELEDQIAAWRSIGAALRVGGRFVVAEVAPDYPEMAQSFTVPPHAPLSWNGDFSDGGQRMLRYRSVRYTSHSQRAQVQYVYDLMADERREQFVNDYEAHVYFPNEMRLLFMVAGFEVERVYGDFDGADLKHCSRHLIFQGRKVK